MPLLIMAFTHGGVFLFVWQQGSRVTKSVEPLTLYPFDSASLIATISA